MDLNYRSVVHRLVEKIVVCHGVEPIVVGTVDEVDPTVEMLQEMVF